MSDGIDQESIFETSDEEEAEPDLEILETCQKKRSFRNMGLIEELVRGIYDYGFQFPSLIQGEVIVPMVRYYFSSFLLSFRFFLLSCFFLLFFFSSLENLFLMIFSVVVISWLKPNPAQERQQLTQFHYFNQQISKYVIIKLW